MIICRQRKIVPVNWIIILPIKWITPAITKESARNRTVHPHTESDNPPDSQECTITKLFMHI
jgi:hypothetical protein